MTIQRNIRSGRDINGTEYDITEFPDTIDYLKEKLSELGYLTFYKHSGFDYSVDIQIEFQMNLSIDARQDSATTSISPDHPVPKLNATNRQE